MKKVVAWGLLSIFLVGILTLAACGPKDMSEQSILLYFANEKMDGVNAESVTVSDDLSREDLLETAMNQLLKGPSSSSSRAVIPEGTTLFWAQAGKSRATLNFSPEFMNTESKVEEVLCRYTVVRTVCELGSGFDSVNILVNGQPLVSKTTGQPVGILRMEDMISSISNDNTSVETVVLYFANDDLLLSQEVREVETKSTETIEKQIVQELLNGPTQEGLSRTIPENTGIISVETKDRICYVNLSREFSESMNTMLDEQLKVYSLVNSLTELSEVDKVQILIEGVIVESLEYMMVQDPIERNENMISEAE